MTEKIENHPVDSIEPESHTHPDEDYKSTLSSYKGYIFLITPSNRNKDLYKP